MVEPVVPAVSLDPALIASVGLSGFLLLAGELMFTVHGKSRAAFTFAVLGIIVLVGSVIASAAWMGYRGEASRQAQERTVELYPSISKEQARDLWLDVSTEGFEDDFRVLRTVPLPPEGNAAGFTKREISLVWNGEGYVLAQSVDGEKFEPLER